MSKKPHLNTHHIIPQSHKDVFNVYDTDNIKQMKMYIHESLHNVFGNLPPHEQFKHLLNIDKPVFTSWFIKHIKEIEDMQLRDIYLKHLLK